MKKQVFMWLSIAMFLAFIVWTILVKTVDVWEVGYNGTKLGFYNINYQFGNLATEFGKFESLGFISDILLYISLGYTAVLVVVGVIQWIKLKSLRKVNKIFFFLAGAYVAIVLIYGFFELVVVNYSPDSTREVLRASYPSTHVFVGGSLFLLNSYVLLKFLTIKLDSFKTMIHLSTVVLSLLLVLTRMLACKHWLTDIIASVILTLAIYFLFIGLCRWLIPNEVKEEQMVDPVEE